MQVLVCVHDPVPRDQAQHDIVRLAIVNRRRFPAKCFDYLLWVNKAISL